MTEKKYTTNTQQCINKKGGSDTQIDYMLTVFIGLYS